MKVKSILFYISILLFITGCNDNAGSDENGKANLKEKKTERLTLQTYMDKIPSNEEFIEKEINYFAPQSGSVYIVCYTENYPLEESVLWNDGTKLIDGLLYVPMIANGDTFKINLRVPVGTIVQYNFWISKDKQGHYQDFWDLQSSGKTTVTDANQIFKNANYTKVEKKNESGLLSKGWLILLLLITVYLPLQWVQKKWIKETEVHSIIEKVLFLGLSLAIFHALARAEIINVNLISFCLSMLILAGVLRIAHSLLATKRYARYVIYSFLVLGLIVISVQTVKTKETWTKGQSENAIISMVYSIYAANSNSSFFTAEIPDDMELFDPAQSTKIETPFGSFKDYNVRNVLFIILESAGASYFDGFGGTYQLSPNLNKYSSEALMFDQMYAHAPATNLSLVSILSSQYPYLSYKSITQEAPDVDLPTLSSVLKEKGYRTSFFPSADLRFQNSKEFLAHRGFDIAEDFSSIKCAEEFQLESSDYREGNGIDDMCLADRLTSWLDEDTTKNFFSMIWTVQGHYPYFFAQEEEDFGVSNHNLNRYLNCMKHNDELVGKVMHALEERGLASTTLVAVTGDYGEAFGQHGQYGHGTAIYEENMRVPLYFINPTLFNGGRKSDVAGMKDLATTTLSIINVDIPAKWHGRDLLSTNSNETFFFSPWSDYLFGYRKDNMKYIFVTNQCQIYKINRY